MSGSDRFLALSAVFVALRNAKGEVLLHRRRNTGYMDGRYDLPSGYVERNETLLDAAVRELREETGVVAKPADLKLWQINQFAANDRDYYYFFFVTDVWEGEPSITEPDKCDDMQFFALQDLPKMTAGTHLALPHLNELEVSFGFIDQPTYDAIAGDS